MERRLSCIKEILMADPAASGHPVMTLLPSLPPGRDPPFHFFLLVDGDGVSACLIKVTGIPLPRELSLIFAHGTTGRRKPLIYALPDRSIARKVSLAKQRSWDYFIATLKTGG